MTEKGHAPIFWIGPSSDETFDRLAEALRRLGLSLERPASAGQLPKA